jgi:ABC-type transport system involved in multi-copper enzyme maturation permease subunit
MSTRTFNVPAWKDVAPAIGWVTFTEILRDKILYNVLFCAFMLFGLGFLASKLTFIRPERVVLDFGLSALSISCTMIAVFFGAGLIGREFDRRTIHVALSHPISKPQFVFGKYLGLAGVLLVNWLLLSISYCGILILMQGVGPTFRNTALIPALVLALIQSMVMAGVTVFLSTFTTTSLSVVMSIGVYLIGQNISELRSVISQVQAPGFKGALRVLVSIPPNLEYFNLGNRLTYALPVGFGFMAESLLYAALIITAFLVAAGFLIHRREV